MNKKVLKKTGSVLYSIFRTAFLIALAYVVLFPIIYAVSSSFLSESQLNDPSIVWLPKYISLTSYSTAWKYMNFGAAFRYTLFTVLLSTLLQMICCSLAGYGFARFKFRGQSLWFALVILTMIVPPQLLVVQQYSIFHDFSFWGVKSVIGFLFKTSTSQNLLDSSFTYLLPAALGQGIQSGLMIYIFRQFFRNLPKELEEAAYIDGCNTIKTFYRIVIPSSLVSFLVVFVLSAVWYWNEDLAASMFFDQRQLLSLALARLQGQLTVDGMDFSSIRNVLMAGGILFITPMTVVYAVLQRFFIQGIERSGLVG